MSREEAEEQLYKDVKRTDTGQRITVTDPAFLTAVDQLTGSYEMAVLGVILILGGVWFLIHNILEISMIGDIRQFGLLYTIGTTKKQLRKSATGRWQAVCLWEVDSEWRFQCFFYSLVFPVCWGRNICGNMVAQKNFPYFDLKS